MTAGSPPTDEHRHRRHRRSSRRGWVPPFRRSHTVLLGGVAVILVVAVALSVALGGWGPGQQPESPSPSLVAAVQSSAPASGMSAPATPDAPASPAPTAHQVVATRIVIDRLGIDLPIVEGDGVDAPLYKVAHYPGTAWPGGGSNIYLYGHARDGMFLSLWNAKLGDRIVLDLADGSQRTYVVTKIMPKVAWNDMALLAPTPHEQLTLQTCTSYEETAPRFVVIAVTAS